MTTAPMGLNRRGWFSFYIFFTNSNTFPSNNGNANDKLFGPLVLNAKTPKRLLNCAHITTALGTPGTLDAIQHAAQCCYA